ncbi:heterokaryon incompatibility protein-domain-containing protein [Dendryphion nanum]|uniref:Heterokaryon incompatibility protein-domain-containing protein n=1 Tax=Dendryphion nanum TaxID=256645 RepID=A0A9P9DGG3_9PLEO|nr:heterokaryon incompatibility protein-domain-containing protein [Dendryphion nanum]
MLPIYQNRALNTIGGEIRLLTIKAADEDNLDGQIECELGHYLLKDSSPEYIEFKNVNKKTASLMEKNLGVSAQDPNEDKSKTEKPRTIFKKWLKGFKTKNGQTTTHTESEDMESQSTYHYVALSYAWGLDIEAENREILINGHPVMVRKNLFAALSQFRNMDHFKNGLKIWIDALTINQEDKDEKRAQILIMHDIYQRAGNIIVWLGPEVEEELGENGKPKELDTQEWSKRENDIFDVHNTVTMLEEIGGYYPTELFEEMDDCGDLAQAHQHREVAGFKLRQALVQWRETIQENPDFFSDTGLTYLFNFFDRPYWRRLWIIQELSMGKANMPVVCGSCVTHWRHVRNAALLLHHVCDIINDMTKEALFRNVEETIDTRSHTASHVAGIAQLELLGHRKTLPEVDKALFSFRSTPGIGGGEALRGSTLDHALQLAMDADCFEPKDRIFGLLHVYGIPKYCKKAVTYTDSPGDIFKAFAKDLLVSGRLEVFALLDGCYDDLELPSWAPNFIRPASRRAAPIHGPWIAGGMNTFKNLHLDMLQMLPTHVVDKEGDDLILLQGVTLIDRIDGVGAIQNILQKRIDTKGSAFLVNVVQPTLPKTKLSPKYANVDEKTVKRLIWRTLTCGTDINGRQALEADFERLLSCFAPERPPPNDLDTWTWDFIDSSAELKFFEKPLRDWLEPYRPRPDLNRANHEERKDWGRVSAALAAMKSKTRSRRLFISEERGLLGLGPNTIQPGHIIATVYGCGKPVVLMPLGGGIFRILGECYVDDLMGGDSGMWKDIPDTDRGSIMLA